jgi:hypothetical protein
MLSLANAEVVSVALMDVRAGVLWATLASQYPTTKYEQPINACTVC